MYRRWRGAADRDARLKAEQQERDDLMEQLAAREGAEKDAQEEAEERAADTEAARRLRAAEGRAAARQARQAEVRERNEERSRQMETRRRAMLAVDAAVAMCVVALIGPHLPRDDRVPRGAWVAAVTPNVFALRARLFVGDEHVGLLEKGCLPPALEIDEKEITDLRQAGQGGFGLVYRGVYRSTPVAVKKMLLHHPDLPDEEFDVGVRRRFVQEGLFLAELKHPRIVQFLGYTFFARDQALGFVTEWVARGSLFHLLHTARPAPPLTPNLAAARARQAAASVAPAAPRATTGR